jgi:transglutaminase-like putative cysteine protease
MRLKLRHETTYEYATPARGAIQILRLTPRNHDAQFVRRWRVEIDADGRLDRDEDAYGNITHTFSIDGPLHALRVLVDGEIDVEASAGMVRGAFERFPVSYWAGATRLTEADPAIAGFAADLASQEGGDRFAFLHRLVAAIYADFTFDLDETHAATTAIEAFSSRKGVCQDFAHVFIAAARSRGIPARYVSGYFFRSDTVEQEAGHAWAEAYVPDIGWIAFDPTHGICADERFIRLAIGRDYLEAAPIRGSRLGGFGEAMAVSVTLSATARSHAAQQ